MYYNTNYCSIIKFLSSLFIIYYFTLWMDGGIWNLEHSLAHLLVAFIKIAALVSSSKYLRIEFLASSKPRASARKSWAPAWSFNIAR